jgi:hypothetical protein
MIVQVCYIYAELMALFAGAMAVMFQLMSPAVFALGRDGYCG